MRKNIFLSLLLLAMIGCGGSRDNFVFTSDQPARPGIPEDIAAIMARPLYQHSVWGLRVVDADSGEVLIDLRPDYPFFIGSVRKVFSVGLLLNEVGQARTYDTPVYLQGQLDDAGVLDGSLVLVASGDLTMGGRRNPDGSLAVTDFDHNEANSLGNAVLSQPDPLAGYRDLARQVAAAGVTRVAGDVVVDERLFEPFNFRGEFDVSPIFVNDNVVDLTIAPTTPGSLADVSVRPLSAALTVESSLLTGPAGSELDLEVEPEFPQNIGTPGATVEVSGNLPVDFEPPFTGEFPVIRTVRITDPANFARTVFVEALEAEGVEVEADTVKPNPVNLLPPEGSYDAVNRVALLVGTPYGELARYILKVSYNIGADTSLLLLGLTQGVHNLAAALVVEEAILSREYGLDPSNFSFVDGSGGGETTATNATVTTLLAALLRSPQGETFLEALPVLAVDGSLGFVTDFASDPTLAGAAGQVRAKTGTYATGNEDGIVVRGQAFAGYIDSKSGRRLIYQLVVNEVPVEDVLDLTRIFQDQGTISAILWRDY